MSAVNSYQHAIDIALSENLRFNAEIKGIDGKVAQLTQAIKEAESALSLLAHMLSKMRSMNPKEDWSGKRNQELRLSFSDAGIAGQAGKKYRQDLQALSDQLKAEKRALEAKRNQLAQEISGNNTLIKINQKALASGSFTDKG